MANSIIETDVAIIGGGGAGIPAAIEVARAGGKAIVLEGAAECGGTAAISGGGCCIVGTPLQKSQGIDDTPDMAFEDWVKWGGGQADEIWARYYLEHTLARSLSLGRELRRQMGRHESSRKATACCAGTGRTTTAWAS